MTQSLECSGCFSGGNETLIHNLRFLHSALQQTNTLEKDSLPLITETLLVDETGREPPSTVRRVWVKETVASRRDEPNSSQSWGFKQPHTLLPSFSLPHPVALWSTLQGLNPLLKTSEVGSRHLEFLVMQPPDLLQVPDACGVSCCWSHLLPMEGNTMLPWFCRRNSFYI